jgi:hypothetical protein
MIVVPLTYNDPQQNKTFVNGTVSLTYISAIGLSVKILRAPWISTGNRDVTVNGDNHF